MFSVFRQTLSVTRRAQGQYVNGIWQEGATSNLNIEASIQPASPDDINLLPEGRKQSKAYTLFTSDSLVTANSNANQNPDIVTIDGDDFIVSVEAIWDNNLINHNKYVVTRQT